MKYLLIILFFFTCTQSFARNYYVSNGGSDSNNGLTQGTAWLTVSKVNSSMSLFVAGDSILFRRGDTFFGQIWITKNGTTALPIVIGAYLTGAKPIISGFTTLTGWANVSGNIWQATPGVTLKKNVNVLTINGTPQAVGRTNWMPFQSATTTQVTSSSLTGTPSYVGAEIVIRKNTFVAEKLTITAQSGGTLTVTSTGQQPINNGQSAAPISGKAGNGFFIQRAANTLDQQGEWFFNQSTNKMQIYSTSNPSGFTIKASYVDTVIKLAGSTNIVVTNIAVEGAGLYGIESYGATNIQVRNCDFNNNTKAIYIWNSNDAVTDGNTINNSFNGGIQINNNQAKRLTVTNNYIHNTGQLIGLGVFNNEHALRGIVAKTSNDGSQNYVNVLYNTVVNTGNGAIQFQGSNVMIAYNVTDSFCNQLDDNGGIYTFVNNQSLNGTVYSNRVVKNNFISNAIGAPLGSANGAIDVAGLYLDDQSGYIRCEDNTIWNIPGNAIQWNNPIRDTLIGNIAFNSDYCLTVNAKQYGPLTGNVIKHNFFYPLTTTQYVIYYTNSGLNNTGQTINQALTSFAYVDSNYYRMKKTTGFRYCYATTQGSGYTCPADINIGSWRTTTGHDIRTAEANPATIVTLWRNPSDNLLVASFSGLRKQDPIGNIFDHSATIDRWEGLLLLDDGNAPVATNTPPTSNAGSTVTITLPTNTATLNGSGTDVDGTIAGYSWIKVSGPAGGTIASPNSASTQINALQQGTYVYQLTVTDDDGATGSSSVNVVVNPAVAANVPPTSNAGSTVTITLPTNTATLNGSGTDSDGTIAGYNWTKVSGPSGGTIATANAASTNLSALQQGTYVYNLEVTDDDGATGNSSVNVVVNPAPNVPPTSNAGSTVTISLPTTTATLNGSGTDQDGTISGYHWTKVSGPSGGTIASPNSASTQINALQQGTYVYNLEVTDNGSPGLTGNSSVQVVVNAANQAPTADAGGDQTITLPVNSTTLYGSGSDVDGNISSYSWTKISGPATGTIASPNSASTALNNLVQGIYVFRLTVTDNQGATGQASVQVTVNGAVTPPNEPPTASAGNDTTITAPQSTYTLQGSGTDNDGTISSYLWRKTAGPAGGAISSPNAASTLVTGLIPGVYFYEIRVIDNSGDSAKATMQLTVNAANTPPTADAGPARSVTLPTDTTTLYGSGSDADGNIVSYQWTKTSGPSGGTITDPTNATTGLTGLTEGIYYYELTVTDNDGGTAKATVQVTVNPVVTTPLPPVADAGPPKGITLPVNSVTLYGSGTDADGTVDTYSWVQLSGPNSATITPTDDSTTVVSNLIEGIYQFQLTVTDDDGLQDTSTVTVTVEPVNVLPSNFLIFLNTKIIN